MSGADQHETPEALDQVVRLIFEPDDSCVHNLAPLMVWLAARDAKLRPEGALRKRIEGLIGPDEVFPDWKSLPHLHRVTEKCDGYTVTTTMLDVSALRAALTEAGGES